MAIKRGRDLAMLFNMACNDLHETAVEKGFWKGKRNDGELIALIHSELSEALEALRHGNPRSETLGDDMYSQAEEELADAVIRIMDMSAARGWDVGGAIVAKSWFNDTRPHKHGKKF